MLVNENDTDIPNINPFQALYDQQFGGSPTAAALKRMDPKPPLGGEENEAAPKPRKAKAQK